MSRNWGAEGGDANHASLAEDPGELGLELSVLQTPGPSGPEKEGGLADTILHKPAQAHGDARAFPPLPHFFAQRGSVQSHTGPFGQGREAAALADVMRKTRESGIDPTRERAASNAAEKGPDS